MPWFGHSQTTKKERRKTMKVMTLAVTAALCASSLFAADVEQLKGLPRGVQSIKYENGVISTLVVVGKAAVPKALRHNPSKAGEKCGEKAKENASFEFTKFLSTKCKWGKTASGETAMKEVAASSTDAEGKDTSTESSSFTETEMTKEQKEQSAQACVSGIQALWEGLNDNGEWVWVGAWNAKAAASIKSMAKTMNEANAEVSDMGKAAAAQKAAEDQKKLDEINGKTRPANDAGAAGATTTEKPEGSDGRPDILKNKDKTSGTATKDADEFL